MPRYKANGKIYNLPEEKVEQFLQTYPNAILVEDEEVKLNGIAETDASVIPGQNMASTSDPGSSGLPKIPNQIGNELQGVSIDDIPRETPTNGELVFGDPRDLNTQITDYRKDYIDAFNGRGRFAEMLVDKNPKERLELIERLIPKPKYVDKKYNRRTDSFDIEPTEEAVEIFNSYLPSDFDLFDKPEQFNKAMEDAKTQALNDDPVVKVMLGARMSVLTKEAEAYQKTLSDKYDLTTPNGVKEANKDYQNWFNTNVVQYIEDSEVIQDMSDQLEDVGDVAMSRKNTEYNRSKDFMLSAFDFSKDSSVLDFGEAMYKGLRQMGVGYRKSVTSQFHGDIIKYDKYLQDYKKRLDAGKISQEKYDGLVKYYENRKQKAQRAIVNNVKAISETEGYLSLFEKSDLKDGTQFDDVVRILGEAIPQIAAAGVGAVTGNPALASLGLVSIFGQEYGSNYYEAITEGLLAEGIKPTEENIAKAISDGKYANRAEAAAFAGLQTALERAGATKVMKNFSKSIGFGDIKKMSSSIYKDGIVDFATKSLPKLKPIAKGAGAEYLTEGAQTGLSQLAVGSQLQLETDLNLGYTKFLNGEEILEAAESGGWVGGLLPFGGATINQTTLEIRNAARDVATKFDLKGSMLKKVNGFFKAAEENLKIKFEKGELTEDQYKEELQNLSNSRNTGIKIPKNYSEESKQRAFDLILQRDKLANEIAGLDESLVEPQKEQIKDINTELAVISLIEKGRIKADQDSAQDTDSATKIGEQLGFSVNKLTPEQIKEKGYNVKEDLGFIEGDQIFLNEDLIGKSTNVKTASHELLHGILYNSIKNGKLSRSIIENWYKNNLSEEQIKVLDQRMEDGGYKTLKTKDGKNYLDVRPDEYLTQIYEAGLIDQPGMFEKVKLLVQDILNSIGVNVNFVKKDDLKDFLRAYQTSIKTGKLSQKVVDVMGGKIDVKAPVASSKITPKAQEFIALNKEGVITNEALVDIINSPSSTSVDKFGAIEAVVEANWPVISNAIKFNPTGSIPMDAVKTAVTEQIQGIFPGRKVPLFKGYNESQGKVNTVISSFLRPRQAEILERAKKIGGITQEGASVDSKEAKQIKDTTTKETTEKVTTKPSKAKESLRKKIKLTDATSKKVVDAVVKTFGTKLPPADSKQFKQALLKAFRTELKTTIAKDVLGSRAAYETFLRDNFEAIIEALPQDVINKRFRPFAEDTGKREKTKEGKKIFKKKDITKAEFIKYFLGRDVGTSTKGTRKDALAEALAQEFATDATMQTIQRPDVREKREFVDKTQTTEKVSKAIDRPTDFAFSKIAKLELSYKQDFYQKLPEIGKAIEASNIDFKDKNSWKNIKSVVSPILGKDFPKLSEVSKDLQKYIKQYSIVKENYKNLDTLPEQSLDEFLFNETKAAETNTNIIKLLELGNVKMTTLFNNVDNIIKQRLFAKELGNHLINTGMKPAEVAKLFISYYKGMYATSSKIGDGGIIIDNQGNVIKGNEKNIGTPRYQSFSNVNDFVNNVIKQIKGLENIKLTPSGQVKNKQNIGGVIVDFNLFSETSKSAIQDKNFAGRKKQAKEARKSIDLMMSFMVDQVLNKKSIYTKEDLAMLMASMKSNMQGPIKRAANLKYIYEGKKVNVKDLRYEHMIPTNYVLLKLLDFYMNSKGSVRNSNVNKLFEQYTVAVIPKGMDKVLEKMKLVDVMPSNYFDGDPSYKRYYNIKTFGAPGVVAIKSIDPKDNGRVIGEQWVAAETAFSKAKVYNEKILPPVIDKKFNKNTTNNQVLDEMEKLDKEASDARVAFSKTQNLNKDFNDIIERATGIGTEKRYGQTKARAVGADKGKFNLLGIPPSAQDFVGLTRYFAGKGKQGDKTIAWVKENFLDPFARANIDISNARVALANDFKALKKLLGVSPKDLNKKITGEPYTVGNAVRVYTWIQQGMTIPGLSKADQKILEDYVTADENLVTFANELIAINKDNGYPKPTDGWLAGTITTDLLSGLNTVVRAKYLKQWQNNVDEVFSETNMNKLEAAYGKGYRDALENMLGRMKTGSNRGFKGDTLTGRFIDWINNSVGAIMFFNMRSAVLQTISAVNFVNWSDNNPLKAAAAFGNQPQYWSDVIKLMNSDYLVERRNGLKINVSEADIAEIAAESKNKAKAFISKILKLGFLPTQIADSFAIASGGATFYRNRYKSLKKEGLSDKEAEAQAFQDFREIAEESQQSSRPDRISQQQAGPMGRIILAFANTPAQYARLMQKAASDIKNRRGDDKTNISKILYYGAIQNVIFNALQQALFAMAFGDEEPDEEKLNKKYTGIANGMADSLLRGVGFHGAAISTLKNVVMKLAEGKEAQDAAIELLDISPPISSKIGKLKSAGRTWDWNKKEIMEKGWSLDNPAYLAAGQVISAATNVPLDRGIRKLQNLKDASDAENEEWMRVANALGWAKWELEWQKDKPKKKKKKKPFGKTLGKTFGKKLKL